MNGEPIAVRAVRRVRWWHATSRKYNRYRAAVIREHSAGFQLPGVLAPTALVDAEDGYGGRYGVVWDRRTRLLTPTLPVVPTPTRPADPARTHTRVAHRGRRLSPLRYIPLLRPGT